MVAVVGLVALWFLVVPVTAIWRCRKCGRLMLDKALREAAFCARCGAPRPRGRDRATLAIAVRPKARIAREVVDRVREILTEEKLADALPLGTTATATIVAEIESGTTIAFAHPTWRPGGVDLVGGLPPYPRRAPLETLPPDIVRVEVEAVELASGGMGSYFGFVGVFVSLLVSLTDGKIWDARASAAR